MGNGKGWFRVNSVMKTKNGRTVHLTKDVDCKTCYFRINCDEDCSQDDRTKRGEGMNMVICEKHETCDKKMWCNHSTQEQSVWTERKIYCPRTDRTVKKVAWDNFRNDYPYCPKCGADLTKGTNT